MFRIDPSKGMVGVDFDDTESGLGGETATLSEPYDFAFVFDDMGEPVESDELLAMGLDDLVFAGVDLTPDLEVMPIGVDGVNDCDLLNPGLLYPALEKTIVEVLARCEPLP